jgi:hypothetical protein
MLAHHSTLTNVIAARLPRPSRTLLRSLLASSLILCVGFTAGVGQARADGDPASDVLAEQELFLPWDAGVSATQQAVIAALLRDLDRDRQPLRAALIASSGDLGSVTTLWRKPQVYAEFLGDELSLVYTGPLLVVMPNGFGFDHLGQSAATIRSALSRIDAPTPGEGLGRVSITAIRRIAAAFGDRIDVSSAEAAASTSVARAAPATPWIVFTVGVAAILLAWILSVRAAPLRLRRRAPASR